MPEDAAPATWSLQLTGTGLTYGDFTWAPPAANTAGQPNTGQVFDDPIGPPPSECGQDATLIHDIQGSGNVSPIEGSDVAIEGIVTAKRKAARSPARPNTNGILVGSVFHPEGTCRVTAPVAPASRLFSRSTVIATRLVGATSGTTAVLGATVTEMAGTTRSSRIT